MTALLHSLGWEVSRRANKVQGLVTHAHYLEENPSGVLERTPAGSGLA